MPNILITIWDIYHQRLEASPPGLENFHPSYRTRPNNANSNLTPGLPANPLPRRLGNGFALQQVGINKVPIQLPN